MSILHGGAYARKVGGAKSHPVFQDASRRCCERGSNDAASERAKNCRTRQTMDVVENEGFLYVHIKSKIVKELIKLELLI